MIRRGNRLVALTRGGWNRIILRNKGGGGKKEAVRGSDQINEGYQAHSWFRQAQPTNGRRNGKSGQAWEPDMLKSVTLNRDGL